MNTSGGHLEQTRVSDRGFGARLLLTMMADTIKRQTCSDPTTASLGRRLANLDWLRDFASLHPCRTAV